MFTYLEFLFRLSAINCFKFLTQTLGKKKQSFFSFSLMITETFNRGDIKILLCDSIINIGFTRFSEEHIQKRLFKSAILMINRCEPSLFKSMSSFKKFSLVILPFDMKLKLLFLKASRKILLDLTNNLS